MALHQAVSRLKKEYQQLLKSPVEGIEAQPLESNILEWRYVLHGPKGTPYEGGVYQGRLIFPQQYPYKPPSIMMLTPNGRFRVDTRLCLSMSDFHPESWNPLWSVSSILSGLLSFMVEDAHTHGSVETTETFKRERARESLAHCCRDPLFVQMFPHYVRLLAERKAAAAPAPAASTAQDASKGAAVDTSRQQRVLEQWARRGSHSRVAAVLLLAALALLASLFLT